MLTENGVHLDARGSVEVLARVFYPRDLVEDDDAGHRRIRDAVQKVNEEEDHHNDDPPFTLGELYDVLQKFNLKIYSKLTPYYFWSS
ncbi:unnamed protein product [Arctia plantaginis]|uniref:Uncharacterized protein n=1 Tax=Arctia plantaginis TaxID=874455 RepID=A0A8S1BJF1_ARCPL|nr:unnamed protein product [Arctia plantaginis]